jgi:transposase
VSAGQRNECELALELLAPARVRHEQRVRTRPQRVCADRGYSTRSIRRYLAERRIQAVIPWRRDQEQDRRGKRLDQRVYRQRNVVERLVGFVRECRRIGTRFEKLALNYLAIVHLGFIRRCLRLLELADRT